MEARRARAETEHSQKKSRKKLQIDGPEQSEGCRGLGGRALGHRDLGHELTNFLNHLGNLRKGTQGAPVLQLVTPLNKGTNGKLPTAAATSAELLTVHSRTDGSVGPGQMLGSDHPSTHAHPSGQANCVNRRAEAIRGLTQRIQEIIDRSREGARQWVLFAQGKPQPTSIDADLLQGESEIQRAAGPS